MLLKIFFCLPSILELYLKYKSMIRNKKINLETFFVVITGSKMLNFHIYIIFKCAPNISESGEKVFNSLKGWQS
jgi:hypothetical protein